MQVIVYTDENGVERTGYPGHDYSITNFDNTAVNTSLTLEERLDSFEEVGEKNYEDLDLKSQDLLQIDEDAAEQDYNEYL